jgi:hypothetical protein
MTMRILPITIVLLAFTEIAAGNPPFESQEESGDQQSGVFDRVVTAVGLGASLRTINAFTINYQNPILFPDNHRADSISQTLLRLTAEQRLVSWLQYEVHAVQSVAATTQTGTNELGSAVPGFGAFGGAIRYRAWGASWAWATESSVSATLWLDRLNVTFVLPWLDVIVGRQAVTFGKAYFWNPLDVFLPFDPRQFDRDYKAGVDAVRFNIPFGQFTGLNLIGVLGSTISVDTGSLKLSTGDISWKGSALLARFYTTISGFDLSLQAGKVYGGYHAGAGVVGEVGPVEVRGEAAYFIVEDTDPLPTLSFASISIPLTGSMRRSHFSGVLGLGHRFANTLTLEAEYLFNGLGDPNHLDSAFVRISTGETLHAGRHLLGVMTSYEILPILTGSLVWIFSFSDYSSLLQPGLALSLADEVDFVFGAMIGLGKRPVGSSLAAPLGLTSEFGTYPNIVYLEFKFYL